MIFVFTALILFFTILFWSIDRLNKMAQQKMPDRAARQVIELSFTLSLGG
jgi:hypothetical protein